jgi:hypothetical protein
MGFNSGTVNQRTLPKLEVLRNFNPTFPEGFTHSARAKSGVTIYSGQLIVLNASGEWELASMYSSAHYLYNYPLSEVYVALDDSLSYDALALAGGSMQELGPNGVGYDRDITQSTAGGTFTTPTGGAVVGYSTMGQYEFQSAYFVHDTTPSGEFIPGLTRIGVSAAAAGDMTGPGYAIALTPGTINQGPVIGVVSRPVKTLNGINSNVPTGTHVLTWRTAYQAQNAVS